MTTAASVRGWTLGIGAQSGGFGSTLAAGSHEEIRLEDVPTLPQTEGDSIDMANVAHADPREWSDKILPYETLMENAITLPMSIRSGTTGNTAPLAKAFLSGGCDVTTTVDDTVATYVSQTSFGLSTGIDDDTSGNAYLVRLGASNDGNFYPVLAAHVNATTDVIIPALGLPSAAADSNTVEAMTCISPATNQVTATNLLSILHTTRGNQNTGNDMAWQYTDCALGSVPQFTITPQGHLILTPTFHTTGRTRIENDLLTETYIDNEKVNLCDGAFEFSYYDASTSAIANAGSSYTMHQARITLGFKTIGIKGEGVSTVKAGIEGYLPDVEPTIIELDFLLDKNLLDDFANSTLTTKFISFVNPTSALTTPAWAFWFPRCDLHAPPTYKPFGDGERYQMCTLTYRATSAKYARTYLSPTPAIYVNTKGDADWFAAIYYDAS